MIVLVGIFPAPNNNALVFVIDDLPIPHPAKIFQKCVRIICSTGYSQHRKVILPAEAKMSRKDHELSHIPECEGQGRSRIAVARHINGVKNSLMPFQTPDCIDHETFSLVTRKTLI